MTRDSSSGRLPWKDWADSTVKPAPPFLRYCLCLATPTFGSGILQPTPLTPSTPRRWIKPVVDADRHKPQRNEEAQREEIIPSLCSFVPLWSRVFLLRHSDSGLRLPGRTASCFHHAEETSLCGGDWGCSASGFD